MKRLLPRLGRCCRTWRLARNSSRHACVGRYDLPNDACTRLYSREDGVIFVTNPPWRRDLLHAIVVNLSSQAPTWLLVDADWLHTQQSAPFMPRLRANVSVGRVRWIQDSPYTGKDNCAWLLFGRAPLNEQVLTRFIGRIEKEAA
jgi:hypothetical protein